MSKQNEPAWLYGQDKPWVGFDLDSTLAYFDSNEFKRLNGDYIGPPVPKMMRKVKRYLSDNVQVKIVTARVADRLEGDSDKIRSNVIKIHNWCIENGLPKLEITCEKDYNMVTLYDDRCVEVEKNTGNTINDKISKVLGPINGMVIDEILECIGDKRVRKMVTNLFAYFEVVHVKSERSDI